MEREERRGSRQPSGVLSFCVCAPTALFPEWSTEYNIRLEISALFVL